MGNFTERSTEVPGVDEVEISTGADYWGEGFIGSGLRHASPMIRVDGRLALAQAVVTNITGGSRYGWNRRAGVKFGPGGRRMYVWVTEELVEELLDSCGWGGGGWRRNKREDARAEKIAGFCMDLVDEIDGTLR